ncbi:hypothetical protein GCM10011519_24090 [Marmoricola endophyticus]|uniref:ABC transporter permease n=1 Tax=Marmoricola endophyticus TaxID=2040280 RepID=A0A917BPI4_9ACTN|nr:hypothetical protein [Marmoricola endophyticus]GGF49330.1 hypothetical protein GCM10011519_24090 [Marmoricola endophyticus]
MRTVVLASVRAHGRRYVAAVLAVLGGVSFVLVTSCLASATKDGLLSGLSASYPGASTVVEDLDPAGPVPPWPPCDSRRGWSPRRGSRCPPAARGRVTTSPSARSPPTRRCVPSG